MHKRAKLQEKTREKKDIRDLMVVAAIQTGSNKSEVAEEFGLTRTTVYSILNRVKVDAPLIDGYKAVRAQINALNQLKRQDLQDVIMDSFNPVEVRGYDPKTKMLMLNTLGLDKGREYEMERVETGQSTENVAVIVMAIKEAKKRMEGEEDGER